MAFLARLLRRDSLVLESVVQELVQWLVVNLNPNENEINDKIATHCSAAIQRADTNEFLYLFLVVLPDAPYLIERCKQDDDSERVDAFVSFVRHARDRMLHLRVDADQPPIYHAQDLVWQSVLHYHCL